MVYVDALRQFKTPILAHIVHSHIKIELLPCAIKLLEDCFDFHLQLFLLVADKNKMINICERGEDVIMIGGFDEERCVTGQ